MDATVDDFLNEINEIAPLKNNKPQYVWQECFDELTGYSYYWNIKTDEVTWSKPLQYISAKDASKHNPSGRKSVNTPPRVAPLFPSTSSKVSIGADSIKIYKIGGNEQKVPSPTNKVVNSRKSRKEVGKNGRKQFKSSDSSEDEKIVLISSYGGDTDSEDDASSKTVAISEKNTQINDDDEEDDVDILTKIQKRAQELKELEALTASVAPETISKPEESPPSNVKDSTGYSLVAGYSDSDEDQDEEIQTLFPAIPPKPEENKVAHSTLFPIAPTIDVNDFLAPAASADEEKTVEAPQIGSVFDPKAFQRKRRIGIDFTVKKTKKTKEETSEAVEDVENERKGFGFFPSDNSYGAFAKGGVLFVKSDVLSAPTKVEDNVNDSSDSAASKEDVEEIYATLKGKLGFLSEGRSPVSPVLTMIIQAETLFTAMKEGGLKLHYIQKWLDETCSELIKLEKEATPDGWLLQWDRLHKRYFYQNQTTGDSQWEYPQPDVVRCDEAMDICTTPPPSGAENSIHLSPPLPPTIRSPTPPPPPVISGDAAEDAKGEVPAVEVPLPAVLLPVKYEENEEPLPPGVDPPEVVPTKQDSDKGVLDNALDSFYSDIAAIESINSPPVPPPPAEEAKSEAISEIPVDLAMKKKKKTKVKLAQGLSMKKKGVSKLVEKWKNVQMGYDD